MNVIITVFLCCVVLSVFYLLIKAAVRDGMKEAFRDLNNDTEDEDDLD